MLTPNDREDLRWAMQAALLEQSQVLTENKETVKDYVLQEATYEQLLNLCFNPYSSDDVYLEATDLEWVAKSTIMEMAGISGELDPEFNLDTTAGKFGLLESIVTEGPVRKKGLTQRSQRTAGGQKKYSPSRSVPGKAAPRTGKTTAQQRLITKNPKPTYQDRKKVVPGKVSAATGKAPSANEIATKKVIAKSREKQAATIAKNTADKKKEGILAKAAKQAGKAKDWAKANPKTAMAAGAAGVAAGAGGAYLYRKRRKKGETKQEAAMHVAECFAQGTPERLKWETLANA